MVCNGHVLTFRSEVLLKVNVASKSHQYLVTLRYNLTEGEKCQRIDIIEGGQTQTEVAEDLTITQESNQDF